MNSNLSIHTKENDGTAEWLGPWSEIDDDGRTNFKNYASSNVYLSRVGGTNTVLQLMDYYSDAVCDTCIWEDNHGIKRAVNLGGAQEAWLTFVYSRKSWEAPDYVTVEVSSNGGATWDIVDRIEHHDWWDHHWIAASYDLGAYLSAETQIRFMTHFNQKNPTYDADYFQIDNVQISYTGSIGLPVAPVLTGTLVDPFSSYASGAGNLAFAGPWVEVGENNGPEKGSFIIRNSVQLQIRGSRKTKSLKRPINLSGATTGTLELRFKRRYLDTNNVVLQASPDNGTTWTELHRFGPGTDDVFQTEQLGIDFSTLGTDQTLMRFLIEGSNAGRVIIDKMELEF